MITYYFCNYHLKTVLIIFTEQHKFKIQLFACGLTASSFYCQAVFHGMDVPQSLNNSNFEGNFGCFQFCVIMNTGIINICMQFSMQV